MPKYPEHEKMHEALSNGPHERDHEIVALLETMWRTGSKGDRESLKQRFFDAQYGHLSRFHHAILPKDIDVHGLEKLHEGYHEDDDLDG